MVVNFIGVLESKDFGFQILEFGLKQKKPNLIQIQLEIDNLQSKIEILQYSDLIIPRSATNHTPDTLL